MQTEDLKLVALFYIKELENLSAKEKLDLMEYVENGSEDDVLFLLATGHKNKEGSFLEITEENGQAYRFQEFFGTVPASVQAGRLAVKGIRAGLRAKEFASTVTSYDPTDVKQAEEKPWGHSTQFLGHTAFMAFADAITLKIKKNHMAKNAKKCEKEKGEAQRICYNIIRKDAIRAQIAALSAMKIKCRRTKDEKTCLQKTELKIKELQKRMDTIKVS